MARKIKALIFGAAIALGVAFYLARAGVPDNAPGEFTGRVIGISDGDTISVLRDGRAVKVRLAGIDCPEARQAFGQAAKKFTADFAFGKPVAVTVSGTDRYERLLGEVTVNSASLNRALLAAGLAWWYRRFSRDETLGELEREARENKRGLWVDKNPVAPWEFRRAPGS